MRLNEIRTKPCIVVDVQPEYTGIHDGNELPWIDDMMSFLNAQAGPILMFVNAEDQGLTNDTIPDIQLYWKNSGFNPDRWNNVEIVDKGFGYLRSWMYLGVDHAVIIKVIRLMYQNKVSDSRELFGGDEDENYIANMTALGVPEQYLRDSISVKWTSVAQLKRFSGAYIMGGGREECLKEVQLLMNAFNIKYKEVQDFIYG